MTDYALSKLRDWNHAAAVLEDRYSPDKAGRQQAGEALIQELDQLFRNAGGPVTAKVEGNRAGLTELTVLAPHRGQLLEVALVRLEYGRFLVCELRALPKLMKDVDGLEYDPVTKSYGAEGVDLLMGLLDVMLKRWLANPL